MSKIYCKNTSGTACFSAKYYSEMYLNPFTKFKTHLKSYKNMAT